MKILKKNKMINKILKSIADNPALKEALKELILKQFNEDSISTQLDDSSLGQVTRARLEGIKKVENAFKEIETLKTVKEKPVEPMPAR